MKRTIMFVLMITVVTGGLLFAQDRGTQRAAPNTRQAPAPEKITASGALTIAKGQIAVQSDGKTFYLMGLNRFIGFIDGLKEGANVQLEGYKMPTWNRNADTEAYMRVTKLTMGGKSYDLDNGFGTFMGMGNGMMGFNWNMPMQNNNRMNNNRMNNRMMPFQNHQQRNNNPRRR